MDALCLSGHAAGFIQITHWSPRQAFLHTGEELTSAVRMGLAYEIVIILIRALPI